MDKVVAITGASSGIGEATALLLARQGAAVVLGARRADRLVAVADAITAAGGRAIAVEVDVTRRHDVERLVARAVAEFGRLDVFVGNAGISKIGPVDDLDVDGWAAMIDVNLRGVLHGRHEPMAALAAWLERVADYAKVKREVFAALETAVWSDLAAHSHGPIGDALTLLLDAGKRAGVVRPDVDARDVVLLLGGLSKLAEDEADERGRRLLAMILDGLRA